MMVNGATVIRCSRVAWKDDDDADILIGAVVVARAVVDVEGGGRFHGLLLDRVYYGQLRAPFAVIWEKSTGRFATVPLDAE